MLLPWSTYRRIGSSDAAASAAAANNTTEIAVLRPTRPKRNLAPLKREPRKGVGSEVDATVLGPLSDAESGRLVQRQRCTAPIGRSLA
jgi:hypothetical protein